MTVKVMPPGVITNAPRVFTTVEGWHIDASFIKQFKLTEAFGIYSVMAITRDNSAWVMKNCFSRGEAEKYLSVLLSKS